MLAIDVLSDRKHQSFETKSCRFGCNYSRFVKKSQGTHSFMSYILVNLFDLIRVSFDNYNYKLSILKQINEIQI